MKALVVGGAGYIGFEVSKALREDYDVWVLDVNDDDCITLVSNKIKFLVGDVVDTYKRPKIMQEFSVIVNLTGGLNDHRLWIRDGINFKSQVCAPMCLRLSNSKARIVHVSSQYVYSTPDMNKERAKAIPACDYGQVMLMSEQALSGDENAVVLRLGTVWGRGMFTNWSSWGNHLYEKKRRGEMIDIFYPTSVLCLLSMENAVRSILWALTSTPGIYNVADKVGFREDIAKEVLGDYPYTNRLSTRAISIGMDCTRIVKQGFKFVKYGSSELGLEEL